MKTGVNKNGVAPLAVNYSEGISDVRITGLHLSPQLHLSLNENLGNAVTKNKTGKEVKTYFKKNITAGKNTYAYDAHTYHTKVPPQGIEAIIEHFTNPNDVVLDPFCGSGMTGIAALRTRRKVLLSDLSPAAVFIAYNYNTPINAVKYMSAVNDLLKKGAALEKELYTTECTKCKKDADVLYTVWSYGMLCNACNKEFILWDVARDEKERPKDSKVKTEFDCPHCKTLIQKRNLKRTKRYPVQIGYKCCTDKGLQESTKVPDRKDLQKINAIENGTKQIPSDLWFPTNEFPDGVNTKQPIAAGLKSIDKIYTKRSLWAFAFLWNEALKAQDETVKVKLLYTLTSLYRRVTLFSEFRFWGGSSNTANLNVSAIINEQNVFKTFRRKANTIKLYFEEAFGKMQSSNLNVSVQSACHLNQLPNKSVDYIFTDPPFGSNINYSEMNFIWESWLQVFTDNKEEAIINKIQNKGNEEYSNLLSEAFKEMRRVLKDDSWLSIVFHNSSKNVWNDLQQAIMRAGFEIKGTLIFDKEHGTFKQFVSENAVGFDLVLHCQKTDDSDFLNSSKRKSSDVYEFIKTELEQNGNNYTVNYLHVEREDEFDYRKLYSNWIKNEIKSAYLNLSFNEFRKIADQIMHGELLL